ncbi:hypothetical protein L9F63_028090, partial [Diploptera punctata]
TNVPGVSATALGLDTLLSSLIIAPAVVGYWRGTWMLMDYHVFPQQHLYSAWVSFTIGAFGHIFFVLMERPFTRWFNPDIHRLAYYLVSRLYTAIFGFVCVNLWRGAWKMLDRYTGLEIWSVLATMLVSVVALAAMRTLRNISAPPFAVATDGYEGYFQVPTMFRVSNVLKYIDNCLIEVESGEYIIIFWRNNINYVR